MSKCRLDEYYILIAEYMEDDPGTTESLTQDDPGTTQDSLREQMTAYWTQPVDHNIKDVTILFLELRKLNKRLFEGE
ncbi:hypothetical protein WDU94_010789 [Cyamophila willieti]